jgi:tetratricopeptide (TPR) repeat protein
MRFDSELDKQRALEAMRRGWVRQAQVEQCQLELGTGESIVTALARRGMLTQAQAHELCSSSGAAPSPEAQSPIPSDHGPGSGTIDEDRLTEVLAEGDLINGRYRIQKLCRGGFGRVYLCGDTLSGRRCALKTLLRKHLASASLLEMFRDEILLWIGLGDHPNIVLAFGMEEYMRLPFVVMECVEGGSLQDALARGPLGWKAAAGFGWQIASGLEYAGQVCGLVHRDLKPANVLLTREGVAKVTGFGIAMVRGAGSPDSAGTPPYMSPEQWDCPADVGVESDIYSFGVMLFELACGRLPFPGQPGYTAGDFRKDHLSQRPPDPRQFQPQMPESMARLILRCLEKRPKDRPAGFAAVRRVLEPFAGTLPQSPSYAPNRVGGLVNQSTTYHLMGRFADAERTARNAVQLDGSSIRARIALANALAERHAYSQALGHLEEAHRLAPGEAGPIVNSALYAALSGDRGRAARWLEIGLSSLPPRQLENLTSMMIDFDRIPKAIEVCEKIVKEDPAAIVAWNSLSIARRRSGNLEMALHCAERTVQINPRYAKGWSNRATILTQLGRFTDAISAADRALEFDSATAGAYAAKAAALGQLGRPAEGRACILKGLAILPGNALLERALQQFN